ncbi:hypothetical protein M231_00826 [Tremella mesenterica]|uniref:Telomere replication protein EST3 n=1 Tax=Tremella mesenterica TaxID=5217 RepID=A0A4V1M4W9_TREME|nr:hypothetical protein M231_00826 [Tremella mesenterica]
MAADIGSWITKAVLQHDRAHGANLSVPWQGSRFCQVIEFHTYRDSNNPHAQIRGVISDATHRVPVVFDVARTDQHETSICGVPSESLTSSLRAVFRLTSFRFHLNPPLTRGDDLELPQLELEILDWTVVTGDKNDPVFFEDADKVGRGRGDGEIQRVLRKWWFGESITDPSQAPTTQSVRRSQVIRRGVGQFEQFLQPYLFATDGKKPKPVPEWIFELPEDVENELERITVFGLDLHPPPSFSQLPDDEVPSGPSGSAESSAKLPPAGQLIPLSPETRSSLEHDPSHQTPLSHPQLSGISLQPIPTYTTSIEISSSIPVNSPHPGHVQDPSSFSPILVDDDTSSDGEIAVRPNVKYVKVKRGFFDFETLISPKTDHKTSSVHPRRQDPTEDESQLSDYEREQRRYAKSRALPLPEIENKTQSQQPSVPSQQGPQEDVSQSLSTSQKSAVEYSLSQYVNKQVNMLVLDPSVVRAELKHLPTPKKTTSSSPIDRSSLSPRRTQVNGHETQIIPAKRPGPREQPPSHPRSSSLGADNASSSSRRSPVRKKPKLQISSLDPSTQSTSPTPHSATSSASRPHLSQSLPPRANELEDARKDEFSSPIRVSSGEEKRGMLGRLVDWTLGRGSVNHNHVEVKQEAQVGPDDQDVTMETGSNDDKELYGLIEDDDGDPDDFSVMNGSDNGSVPIGRTVGMRTNAPSADSEDSEDDRSYVGKQTNNEARAVTDREDQRVPGDEDEDDGEDHVQSIGARESRGQADDLGDRADMKSVGNGGDDEGNEGYDAGEKDANNEEDLEEIPPNIPTSFDHTHALSSPIPSIPLPVPLESSGPHLMSIHEDESMETRSVVAQSHTSAVPLSTDPTQAATTLHEASSPPSHIQKPFPATPQAAVRHVVPLHIPSSAKSKDEMSTIAIPKTRTKLGGFKLDLNPPFGLPTSVVTKMASRATEVRSRASTRISRS